MLKLFQSIFSTSPAPGAKYPASIVAEAIERAVDGTNSRIRAVPGYKRKLEPSVVHAIDHVVTLVDAFPAPIELSGGFHRDPRLSLLLGSPDRMREMLSTEQSLREFLRTPAGGTAQHITALLMARIEQRDVLGMELVGEIIRRDVRQVAVDVNERRLVDPGESEDVTRHQLRRRAFDHLLEIALHHISAVSRERTGLEVERTLLSRKLKLLRSAGWTFDADGGGSEIAPTEIEAKLDAIEHQLATLGGQTGSLEVHLDCVADVLAKAGEQLSMEHEHLIVDRMNIRRDVPSDDTLEIDLQVLHSALGRTAVAMPVRIARVELRAPPDRVAEMRRTLG